MSNLEKNDRFEEKLYTFAKNFNKYNNHNWF